MTRTKTRNKNPKWGFWDITDEQAEKINSGDVDEYNAFFMRNYDKISGLAYKEVARLTQGEHYQSEKQKEDVINAFYIDGLQHRFQTGALLCYILHLSALAVDRSSYQLAHKNSPHTLERSYKPDFIFIPTEINTATMRIDDSEIYSIIDLYETAPSPEEEREKHEQIENQNHLCHAFEGFFDETTSLYFPFYLNGIKPAHADQRLNRKGGSSYYKRIEKKLITHYKEVLAMLSQYGYQIPVHLQNELPDKYNEYVLPYLEKERKRQERENEKERKREEREKRALTRQERLREYNREYKRQQRAKAKILPVDATA